MTSHSTQTHRPLAINSILASLVSAAIIIALVAIGGDAAAETPVSLDGSTQADMIEVYIVQPGDTLWGIASAIAEPGDDVDAIIDVLHDAAGSSNLDVGQRIVIDYSLFVG